MTEELLSQFLETESPKETGPKVLEGSLKKLRYVNCFFILLVFKSSKTTPCRLQFLNSQVSDSPQGNSLAQVHKNGKK